MASLRSIGRRYASDYAWLGSRSRERSTFPEVPAVLASLRGRGFRIGLCSNLALPYVAPIQRLLGPLVDDSIWSCDAGLLKPDPAIYQLAVSRLAVPEDSVLMVGDTYTADVEGPRNAGLKAKLLDRSGKELKGSWATLEMLL
ncbi:HAD family hydrolase [Xanthomonas arboricola pv. corylina]|uniref:HAD family hydrolase n=1 Tax=Xanthomonas arboricola TaxID=56448 RepID=UPI0040409A4B